MNSDNMALIAAKPTLMGLPIETRQQIWEEYFRDTSYSPVIHIDIGVHSSKPNAPLKSRISRKGNFENSLLRVSKQTAAENKPRTAISLIVQLYPRHEILGNRDAFEEIPLQLLSRIETARVYALSNALTPLDRNGNNILIKHLTLSAFARFSNFKHLTLTYIDKDLYIMPNRPLQCEWLKLRAGIEGSTFVDLSTERDILSGMQDQRIKESMAENIHVLDYLIPTGHRTFDLRLTFQLTYYTVVSLYKSTQGSTRELNWCWPIWSYDQKDFVATADRKILCWKRTTTLEDAEVEETL